MHQYDFQELELLNSVGAHIFTNTLRQLLATSTSLKHLKFQFVDTLNDEVVALINAFQMYWISTQVCAELMRSNPLKHLCTLTLDQVQHREAGARNPMSEFSFDSDQSFLSPVPQCISSLPPPLP